MWIVHVKSDEMPNINHLGNGKSRTPLFFKYVQADVSVTVYVWMENFSPECNL